MAAKTNVTASRILHKFLTQGNFHANTGEDDTADGKTDEGDSELNVTALHPLNTVFLITNAAAKKIDDGEWADGELEKIHSFSNPVMTSEKRRKLDDVVRRTVEDQARVSSLPTRPLVIPQFPDAGESGPSFLLHMAHRKNEDPLAPHYWDQPTFSMGTLREKGVDPAWNCASDVHWRPERAPKKGDGVECITRIAYRPEEIDAHIRATKSIIEIIGGVWIVMGKCAQLAVLQKMCFLDLKELQIPVGEDIEGEEQYLHVAFVFNTSSLHSIFIFTRHPGSHGYAGTTDPVHAQILDMAINFAFAIHGRGCEPGYYVNLLAQSFSRAPLIRLSKLEEKERARGSPLPREDIPADLLDWIDNRLSWINLNVNLLFKHGESVVMPAKELATRWCKRFTRVRTEQVAAAQHLIACYDHATIIQQQLASVTASGSVVSRKRKANVLAPTAPEDHFESNRPERRASQQTVVSQLLSDGLDVTISSGEFSLFAFLVPVSKEWLQTQSSQSKEGVVNQTRRIRVRCELASAESWHEHAALFQKLTPVIPDLDELPHTMSVKDRSRLAAEVLSREDMEVLDYVLTEPSTRARNKKYGNLFNGHGDLIISSGVVKIIFAQDVNKRAIVPEKVRKSYTNSINVREHVRKYLGLPTHQPAVLEEPASRLAFELSVEREDGGPPATIWRQSEYNKKSYLLLPRLNRIVDILEGYSKFWSLRQPHRCVIDRYKSRIRYTKCDEQDCEKCKDFPADSSTVISSRLELAE